MDPRLRTSELYTLIRCFSVLHSRHATSAVAPRVVAPAGHADTAAPPSAAPSAPAGGDAEKDETHRAVMAKLQASGASFTTLQHTPTRTSEESAAVRGVPLASGAKAMLLKAGKPLSHGGLYVLAVMSASRTLDWTKMKKAADSPRLSMASVEDVASVTGCIPGAVPPFGSLFAGVATFVDRSLLDQGAFINFNAGLRTFSVCQLPVTDYLRIEHPTVADFTS